jgi:zinc D-Ala-D-Ala carboxypeptidase
MQISKNFTLDELLKSPTALQWDFKEQFTPPEDVVENLIQLVVNVLQPLRDKIGRPIRITSGYRSPRVNSKVGGASTRINGRVVQTSQHVLGEAADIECWVDGRESNNLIIEALRELAKSPDFEWDQIIKEFGTENNPSWIHVSFRKGKNRKQVLRKVQGRPYVNTTL